MREELRLSSEKQLSVSFKKNTAARPPFIMVWSKTGRTIHAVLESAFLLHTLYCSSYGVKRQYLFPSSLPHKRNAPFIPMFQNRGLLARFDKDSSSVYICLPGYTYNEIINFDNFQFFSQLVSGVRI
ncbi:hypothetical protein Krac_5306 [Ktedonobacter racemifer DSM 44963]|uniref:Uncharacterized protein n=1 Tax=Ktedonobacter racemifer DSM 44963 TaxID=485913 RepID=D6TVP7_KTERA|nr:hypothetical protein Krac_5306 [Ktedonobacter racemifer DSM 44963]